MSSILRFSKANPIRIAILQMDGINTNNIDHQLWHKKSKPNVESYCQKWNKADTIYFQTDTSFQSNFVEVVRAYDQQVIVSDFTEETMLFEDGEVMLFEDGDTMLFEGSDDSISETIKDNSTYITRETTIPLADLAAGKYYIQCFGEHSDGKTYYARSEIIDVQTSHRNTLLFKYYNNEPAFGIDYRSGLVMQFRLMADFVKPADDNQFENITSAESVITKVTDRTIEARVLELMEDVPGWMIQKVNLILAHDSCKIDDLEVSGREKVSFDYQIAGRAWIDAGASVVIPLKESDYFNRHDSGSRVLFA